MTKDMIVECPKCKIKASTDEGIEEKFGWRKTDGKTIPQSWCRRCRSGKPTEDVEEKKPEKINKNLWSSLESRANRLHDLESLRHLFTKSDGLNYNYKNEVLPTENWSAEAKRIVSGHSAECTIIAEKSSFDVVYIKIETDEEIKWKKLAEEVFSRVRYALLISHNPKGNKWIFTGSSGEARSAKHIPVEIDANSVPPTFVEWLYKIRVEDDDTLQRLVIKIDSAFDEFALDIQDKLGENVFEALRALIHEAVFNKSNGLKFDNETLLRITEPLFTLLYRLMFVLYAESRGVFNVDNKTYYNNFSLKKIVTEYIRDWQKNPNKLELKKYEVWARFVQLFHLIESGSKSLNFDESEFKMLAYNGSLFNSDLHQELEKWKFDNNSLLEALHYLTRIQDREKNWSFVNYASIEIRHIGTIYEKLLEFHPEKSGNKIEIFTHEGKREVEGTYYTPKFIVDNIVENVFGPIIDNIVENKKNPRDQIEQILQLKILDPAMGSGHFLVGAADYLAKRIITIDKDESEQNLIERKRDVVRRCLYGVDINPLAVELAKMSLWLDTLSTEHALSFLATHIKNGNAILTSWRKKIFDEQTSLVEDPSRTYFRDFVKQYSAFETIDDNRASTVRAKIEEEKESRKSGSPYDQLKYLFDVQLSKYYGNEIKDWRDLRSKIGTKEFNKIVKSGNWSLNRHFAEDSHFFHWELEFPQVFFDDKGEKLDNPGFDVIIGNPPYGVNYEGNYFDSFELSSKESYGFFMAQGIKILKKGGILSMVVSDTWRMLKTHLPLRKIILESCVINRLVKLSRYAFKTYGRNIDAFTIICQFKKEKSEHRSAYYFYDFWQIHPLNEREYFSNLLSFANYKMEKNSWFFDNERSMRYQIHQKLIESSINLSIFDGDEDLFRFFGKNTQIIDVELK